MHLFFGFGGKSSNLELTLGLLPLLNEISTAIDDLGLNELSLVLFARSLNSFNERVDELQSEVGSIAVQILFFVHRQHQAHTIFP